MLTLFLAMPHTKPPPSPPYQGPDSQTRIAVHSQPSPATRWSPLTRVAFRVAFIYLALYAATRTVEVFFVPDGDRESWLSTAYNWASNAVSVSAGWLAQRALALPSDTPLGPPSDSTGGWLACAGFLLIAVVAGAVWSVVDRKRPSYETLLAWLHVAIRWALGFTLIWYGVMKISRGQFNPDTNSLYRLMTPVGGLSPAALLWVTMTYGYGYAAAAGLVELSAGLLLFWRRTATLGALIAVGAMGNVFMLNVVYGIHLKQTSLHLTLMAAFLVLPDARRLIDALVLGRAVPALVRRPLVTRERSRRLWQLGAAALLAHGVYVNLNPVDWYAIWRADRAPGSPFAGIYEVESFARNGQTVPPVQGDASRWRYVLVERTGYATIWLMSDAVADYLTSVDTARATVRLFAPPAPGPAHSEGSLRYLLATPRYDARYWYVDSYETALRTVRDVPNAEQARLTYTRSERDRLVLQGRLGSDSIVVSLRRHDRGELFLLKWPFGWTFDHEYPATNAETLTPATPWRGPAPIPDVPAQGPR